MPHSQKRTDQQWLDALKGASGFREQDKALLELANYLFIVACSYLHKQKYLLSRLRYLSNDDLAALAEECVQRFMEKMIRDDFALLDKYSGRGSFLAWAAQVITNLCCSELRRSAWHRNQPLEPGPSQADPDAAPPEEAAYWALLRETLTRCLDNLPERYRFALTQCVVEDQNAADVGEALNISANAVYIMVYRAKKMMREYLESEGIGRDVLLERTG